MSTRSDQDIALILGSLDAEDLQRLLPPDDLWDSIAAAVFAADDGEDADGDANDTPASAPSNVRSLRSARTRPTGWLMAAAAAVALLVGALMAIDRSSVTTVAEVALSSDGLQGAPRALSGRAELVETGDGLEIDLDVPDSIDARGGYLELWLIDENVEGMVSLGPLNDSGRYPVPAGVDPGAFPVVDVSVEPADGVPTHSGRSVLRGVLDA